MTAPVESHAFGLRLDLEFEVPGLWRSPSGRPRMRLREATPEHIDAGWDDGRAEGLVPGATFNLVVRTEERLTRQLELASLVAAGAGLHSLKIPAGVDPDETAVAVEAHATGARR